MNILYVENHAVFAETVKQRFLSAHSVTVVPSLTAARNAIASATFDLLLVDYDLDDGKGDELVREFRASGNQAIIIGVSSHAEGNNALMNAGANEVCSKMKFNQIENVFDRLKRKKNAINM